LDRLYGDRRELLMRAEVDIVLRQFVDQKSTIHGLRSMGGAEFLSIGISPELDASTMRAIATLSCFAGVFVDLDGRRLQIPDIDVPVVDLPTSLLTTQRYRGKTNETFTRMMVNIARALAPQPPPATRRLCVLDPLAGRGTTLNAAAYAGLDAVGVESSGPDVAQYLLFIVRWLEENRVKHKVEKNRVTLADRSKAARTDISYRRTRTDMNDQTAGHIAVVTGDSSLAAASLPKAGCDALVTDLPYGVQHGAVANSARHRSAVELVRQCAPVWARALRANAPLVLAFNTRTTDRTEMLTALGEAQIEEHEAATGHDFFHIVDSSIHRDVVVARKTS
jgi:Putative RNA methylase family UPF0020